MVIADISNESESDDVVTNIEDPYLYYS